MKRAIRRAAPVAALGAAVWFLVFRQVTASELRAALTGVNPWALALALGAMGIYFLCEASNTALGLRRLGYRAGLGRCLQYTAAGFFFSAVTPSASGGQPMQLYYMGRQQVDPGHGALVLLLELACWQAVSVLYGAVGLWLGRQVFSEVTGPVRLLAVVGMGLNLLTLGLILAAILFPGWARRLGAGLSGRLARRPKLLAFWNKARLQLERFSDAAPLVRRSPSLLLAMFLTTAVQLALLYSVPFWIYRAMGLAGWSLPAVAAVQAVVSLSVSSLPLPGAMGVGESGFLTAFRLMFPAQLLGSAMVLSRSVSFYLFVLLTGLSLAACSLADRKKSRRSSKISLTFRNSNLV